MTLSSQAGYEIGVLMSRSPGELRAGELPSSHSVVGSLKVFDAVVMVTVPWRTNTQCRPARWR